MNKILSKNVFSFIQSPQKMLIMTSYDCLEDVVLVPSWIKTMAT